MADWKLLGYVPDSDEEEDGIISVTALSHQNPEPKAEDAPHLLTHPGKEERTTGTGDQRHDPTSRPGTSARIFENSRTTAEQLEETLSQGLLTVRDILSQSRPSVEVDQSDDSPLSTPPSSLASSPRLSHGVVPLAATAVSQPVYRQELTPLQSFEFEFAQRRSLRTRAPIQLHPYMLEDAKYRELMKARGVKPVHVPNETQPGEQTQSAENSQDAELFESSQAEETQSFRVPPSPTLMPQDDEESQSPVPGSRLIRTNRLLNDELPDLTQILQRRSHPQPKQSRARGHGSSHLNEVVRQHPDTDVYDLPSDDDVPAQDSFRVPLSPPRSSSVEMTDTQLVTDDGSPLKTASPNVRLTPLLSSENGFRKRLKLVVSSSQESSSESEDELGNKESFAGEEESQGLRNMGKRIRGVLPASWLKLDMKQRSRPSGRMPPARSPSKAELNKGVAQYTSVREHALETVSRSNAFVTFDLDESSDSDSAGNDVFAEENHVRGPVLTADGDSDVHMDDVVEEDFIDAMLPSSGIKHNRSASGRKQSQQRISGGISTTISGRSNRAQETSSAGEKARRRRGRRETAGKKRKTTHKQSSPRMNVLDAPGIINVDKSAQPRFLKVAARQARKSVRTVGLPASKKVFDLANRTETKELYAEVQSWESKHNIYQRPAFYRSNRDPGNDTGALDDGKDGAEPPQVFKATTSRNQFTPTTEALNTLKDNTSALLSRSSDKSSNPLGVNKVLARAGINTGPFGSEASTSKPSAYAHRLFPHSNRSGRGHLISITAQPRPAQLESEVCSDRLQLFKPPRRAPGKPLQRPDSFCTVDSLQVSTRAAQIHKAQDQIPQHKITRKPRKQIPHRHLVSEANIETASNFERQPIGKSMDVQARTERIAISQSAQENNDTLDRDIDDWMRRTVDHMKRLFIFPTQTAFANNAVGQEALYQAISQSTNPVLNTSIPKSIDSRLELASADVDLVLGSYDALAMAGIDKIQSFIHRSLRHENVLRFAQARQDCITGIRSVFRYVNRSISFPPDSGAYIPAHELTGQSMSSLSSLTEALDDSSKADSNHRNSSYSPQLYFLTTSLAFVKKISALIHLDSLEYQSPHFHFFLELHIWLTLHVLQLHSIAAGIEDVRRQAQDLCEHMICDGLSCVLDFHQLDRYHMSDLGWFDPQGRANLVFGRASTPAEMVLVAWHICKTLSKNGSSQLFYKLLSHNMHHLGSIKRMCSIMLATSYAVRFTQLDARGHFIEDPSNRPHADGTEWTYLLSSAQKIFDTVREDVTDELEKSILMQLKHETMMFYHLQIRDFGWKPTSALLAMMFRSYSQNNYVAFDETWILERIFYNHDLVRYVPDAERNDYDHFLDFVGRFITQEQLSISEEEVGSANKAAKLRAIVYSLFPNDAQHFDARQSIAMTDFVGAKNRLALYIQLYRSAPEGCQPRIEQLSRQVDLSQSHTSICELAMKLWEVIAIYEVKHNQSGSANTGRLSEWLNSMILQIVSRYEHNVHDSEYQHDIQDTADLFAKLFEVLGTCLAACTSEISARMLLQTALPTLEGILEYGREFGNSEKALNAGLIALRAYVQKTVDTQNNGTLTTRILTIVRDILQHILNQERAPTKDLVQNATAAWFTIAFSLVQSLHKTWDDFLLPHSNLSIEFLGELYDSERCSESKRQFLSKIIEIEKDAIFLEYRPLIFANWIASLLVPTLGSESTLLLTDRIVQHGADSLDLRTLFENTKKGQLAEKLTNRDLSESRFSILRHIIENIYKQQNDPESEYLAGGLDEKDMQMILRVITSTMKNLWLRLRDDPTTQSAYGWLVEAVTDVLELYPVKGFKLDLWFHDGTGMPRSQQPLESMFRCRFGEESGDLAKSSIVTFRMKAIQAVRFNRQPAFTSELEQVLHCTNPLRVRIGASGQPEYSIDLVKQTKFVQIVFPAYIERASTKEGAAVALPILASLTTITANMVFRIDNSEPHRMAAFALASLSCLSAALGAIRAQSQVTGTLLAYANVAVATIWSLLCNEEVEIGEDAHEAFSATVMGLAGCACSLLPGEAGEMELRALRFASLFGGVERGPELGEEERELGRFAREDLWEVLRVVGGAMEVKRGGAEGGKEKEEARALLRLVEELPFLPEE